MKTTNKNKELLGIKPGGTYLPLGFRQLMYDKLESIKKEGVLA
jgi:hypothetical protein